MKKPVDPPSRAERSGTRWAARLRPRRPPTWHYHFPFYEMERRRGAETEICS